MINTNLCFVFVGCAALGNFSFFFLLSSFFFLLDTQTASSDNAHVELLGLIFHPPIILHTRR